MTVTNKIKESIVNKNKTILTEMGFHRSDIEEAVTDLINRGTIVPHISLVSSGNLTVILCYENKLLYVGHASNLDKEAF